MSYQLDSRFRLRLLSALADALQRVKIHPGEYRDAWMSGYIMPCNTLFENRNKEKGHFERYIGDFAFVRYAVDFMTRRTSGVTLPDDLPVPLQAVRGCENLDDLAEQIVSGFESLPTRLALSCPVSPELSEVLSTINSPFSIADRVVVFPNSSHMADFPYTYGSANLVGEIQLSLLLTAKDRAVSREVV